MAEKLTRKEKIALQKKAPGFSPKQIEAQQNKRISLRRSLGLLVAIVGFLIYSNTLNHEYVLDDWGLIKDNVQTRGGIKSVPDIFKSSYRFGMNISDYQLYRPLSKAMFAVEWQISPDNPSLSHWINVLFFAISCYVLFLVLSKFMSNKLTVPFIAALLFASHPLHTEVVANIKSRDEIVSFLFLMLTAGLYHDYVVKNSKKSFLLGTFTYLVALFTKESSVTFLAVIPLMFYFFTNAGKIKYYRVLLAMGGCAAFFLLIRMQVLGNVKTLIPPEDNSLLEIKGFLLQRVNAFYIMGHYLKLLVWPAPLVSDGSYNTFPEIGITSWKFFVPFMVFIGAAVYAIITFKKKDPIAFAILYFFITASIVSNIIILIGTNYGERLMYMPSLGFCLIVAILISKILKPNTEEKEMNSMNSFFSSSAKPIMLIGIVVILFAYQAMSRNLEWKDNLTLYQHDTKKVPNSAHMLFYLANHITTEEYLKALPDSAARTKSREEGLELLTRAVEIYPKYADGYQRRGFIYNQMKRPDLAEEDYKMALKYNPTHPIVYNNYGTLCFDQRRYDESLKNFQLAVKYNPNYAHALNNMASIYGVIGTGEQMEMTSDPAHRAEHERKARENFETAVMYFKKSIDADPDFGEPYRLLAITYRNLNNPSMGEKYERLYKQVMDKSNVKN